MNYEKEYLNITREKMDSLILDDGKWYNSEERIFEIRKNFNSIAKELNDQTKLFNDKRVTSTFLEIIEIASMFYYTSAFMLFRSFTVLFVMEYKNWTKEEFEENKGDKGDFDFAFKQWKNIYNNNNYLGKSYHKKMSETLDNHQLKEKQYFKEREKIRKYCNKHAHTEIGYIYENNVHASKAIYYLGHIIRSSIGMIILLIMKNEEKEK